MRGRWDRWRTEFRQAGRFAWAGIPIPALVGLTANAMSETEVSSAGEIGLYQTMPGTWDRLRTDARVRRILGGRDAVSRAGAWRTSPADQIAIGVCDYADNAGEVARALPANVRPTNTASQWAYACGVTGYVIGAGGAARVLGRLAQPVGDAHALSVVLAAAAASSLSREAAHGLVRTWQRLACGRDLHRAVGDFEGVPAGRGFSIGQTDWQVEQGRPGTPGLRGGWPVNLGSVSFPGALERAAALVPWNDEAAAWYALGVPDGTAERITAAYYPDGAPTWALQPAQYGPAIEAASSATASTGGRLALAGAVGAGLAWVYVRRRRGR